jgi:hypothetical protein
MRFLMTPSYFQIAKSTLVALKAEGYKLGLASSTIKLEDFEGDEDDGAFAVF